MLLGREENGVVITGLAAESTTQRLFLLHRNSGAPGAPAQLLGRSRETPQRSREVAEASSPSKGVGAGRYSVRNAECGDCHQGDLINSTE